MNSYQILIPLATLLTGIFLLGGSEIFDRHFRANQSWIVHTFILSLAFVQQVLLYRLPPNLFARGGMILDGTTQVFTLSVLLLSILMQVNRRTESRPLLSQISLMTLGVTFLSIFAIESNRILFSVLAILGMIWISQAALAAESGPDEQAALVHSAMVRGLIFLVVGVFLCILCFSTFGESQIDEIQRVIVRGHFRDFPLFVIEITILFLGGLVLGLPPFEGLLGRSRNRASWSLSLGFTGIFAVVGINIFVRWGLLVFTRPAIGAMELEPLTNWNVLYIIRVISVIALVLVPVLAILSANVRGSFLFFVMNPFVQALFALSFGQKEIIGVALAQVVVAVIIIGLIMTSIQSLKFSPDATLQDWLALGRKDMTACLSVILGLSSAAGIAPFYGSLLLQKTLSINSAFGLVLLLNLVLASFYVGRLLTLAFHKGGEESKLSHVSRGEKLWFAVQFILLIFMGIFWQPLYKYGAFSIRQFFGEI